MLVLKVFSEGTLSWEHHQLDCGIHSGRHFVMHEGALSVHSKVLLVVFAGRQGFDPTNAPRSHVSAFSEVYSKAVPSRKHFLVA